MENNIKKKVNRIGLVGQIVSIILIVMMAVASFGCLVGGVVLAVLPQDSVLIGFDGDVDITVGKGLIGRWMDRIPEDEINAQLGINGTNYSNMVAEKTDKGIVFRAESERMEFSLKRLSSAVFTGLIYCASMLVIFIFLKRLCDGFRHCDSPFSDDVIRRMTVFAWVLLIGSVAASTAEAVVNSLIGRSLDLSFSLNPTGVNPGFEVSFSFAPIIIALIVLFLTMIFRYGAQLQREADETL